MNSPRVLEQYRRAWRCDCDGATHADGVLPRGGLSQSVLHMKAGIKEITGHEPSTCPWRAFYDPIVDRVLRVATLADEGLGAAAVGVDPPAILLDGLSVYFAARNATRAHDWAADPNNPRNKK